MEALADAVRLPRHRLRFCMVDIVDGQIQLVIILLHLTTVLRSPVGQYSQHWQSLGLVERQYTIIKQVGGGERRFTRIQLAVCPFRVRIHERLLVDAAHTFQIAHVEGVLRPQIPRMYRLGFTTGIVIVRLLLQRCDLSLSKHDAFSGDLFLKRLQAFTEIL